MTESVRTALEDAEPIDPDHYFAQVRFDSGPVYGLVDAQLPPESAPLDLDEARVVVAERIDDDEFGTKPVLTVMFEEVDGVEVAASEDVAAEPDSDQAHVEMLVAKADAEIGELPNSVVQTPRDAAAIIKKAMEKRRLDRVTTTPEDVLGLPGRYRNAARFLIEAGFHKVASPSSSEVYELTRPVARTEESDQTPELAAAA